MFVLERNFFGSVEFEDLSHIYLTIFRLLTHQTFQLPPLRLVIKVFPSPLVENFSAFIRDESCLHYRVQDFFFILSKQPNREEKH